MQSVATRIVVERERERMAFHAADYWSLEGTFAVPRPAAATDEGEPTTVKAKLVSVDDSRVATGKDFDPATGRVTGDVVHLDEAGARGLAARLEGRQVTVSRVDEKPYRRRPYAPFTTSTLQMEAGRKLGWSSAQTMRVAQRLYENGHITYMRTDSTNLSDEAINAARQQARELYGDAYVPAEARRYKSKAKGAQEAHEAIRPAGDSFRTPGQLAAQLARDEFRLYELVWQRTVASQMADAVGQTVSIRLAGRSTTDEAVEFTASGRTITFPGFLKAYVESQDESGPGQRRRRARQRRRRAPAAPPGARAAARHPGARGQGPHAPPRRPATPSRAWSPGWRSWASAARRPTRRSCRRSRTAGTSGRRATRWCPPSSRSPSSTCWSSTSPSSSTTTSPPRWRRSSTRSPAAPCSGSTG